MSDHTATTGTQSIENAVTHCRATGAFDPGDDHIFGLPESETAMEDINLSVSLLRRAQRRIEEGDTAFPDTAPEAPAKNHYTETEIVVMTPTVEDAAKVAEVAAQQAEHYAEVAGESWDVEMALDAHAEAKSCSLTADRAAARARVLAQGTIRAACRGSQLRTSPDLHDRMRAADAAAAAVRASLFVTEAWEAVTAMREGESYFN